ncbi:MAG: hypothetical protein ACOCXD_01695 [Bacteroidota bacterium]
MDSKEEKIVEKRFCRKKSSYVYIEKVVSKIIMTNEEKQELKDNYLAETLNEPKFKSVQCLDAEDNCSGCALRSLETYDNYNRSLIVEYSTGFSSYNNNGYKGILLTDYTTDAK